MDIVDIPEENVTFILSPKLIVDAVPSGEFEDLILTPVPSPTILIKFDPSSWGNVPTILPAGTLVSPEAEPTNVEADIIPVILAFPPTFNL